MNTAPTFLLHFNLSFNFHLNRFPARSIVPMSCISRSNVFSLPTRDITSWPITSSCERRHVPEGTLLFVTPSLLSHSKPKFDAESLSVPEGEQQTAASDSFLPLGWAASAQSLQRSPGQHTGEPAPLLGELMP